MKTSTTNRPVSVLQVTIGDGSYGGVANFLYNYYSHMDHSVVHYDFLYCGENSMQSRQDDDVLKGSNIYTLHILKRNNNGLSEYFRLIAALKKLFDEKRYDIVHVNSSNLFVNACVTYALRGRAKCIAHSHNTKSTIEYAGFAKRVFKAMIRGAVQRFIVKRDDALFACSTEAGKYLFGDKAVSLPKFRHIYNAIDIRRYAYDASVRASYRKDDRLVVGFVGRLADQKNPGFAIDVFSALHRSRPDSVMWMVGEGELQNKIARQIHDQGLEGSVELLGRRADIAELMQAMDLLLVPSLYEGLGIVIIEAQAAGLPAFVSDVVPEEAKVSALVCPISLKESAEAWAETILKGVTGAETRPDMIETMANAGYDILRASKELQDIYVEMADR